MLFILRHCLLETWNTLFLYLLYFIWQNCTTPPFNRNFGIFLGWHVIIWDGSQIKAFPNPDHPPLAIFFTYPSFRTKLKNLCLFEVIYQSIWLQWKWKFISLYIVKLSWNDHDCLHNMFFGSINVCISQNDPKVVTTRSPSGQNWSERGHQVVINSSIGPPSYPKEVNEWLPIDP